LSPALRAAAWIARRGTEGWTQADAAALEAWLKESASHRVAYYRINAAWEEAGRLRALKGRAAGSLRAASPGSGHHSRLPLGLAAGLVFMVLIGLLWGYKNELFHSNHYVTVVGGLEAVPLADGSRVTLNTDSDLRVLLSPKERDVELNRGEAFFEVAKDPSRPFVVNAGRKRIIAVGTQFSVLRQGDDIRVVVNEGTVRLEDSSGGPTTRNIQNSEGQLETVVLPAGSVARVESDAVLVRRAGSAEIEQHLSWRSGLLTFRDTPLSEAVAEFNRYNERKIIIQDSSIGSLQLGGIFRSTNIDPFIDLLEQGFPVRAKVDGDRILLTHN
jgi:transmembrane sensor